MNLKRLFIEISFVLIAASTSAQTEKYLKVKNFFSTVSSIQIANKDSNVAVIFVSANKCAKCMDELSNELNKAVNSTSAVIFYLLIRVGESPELRRESIDMLNLTEKTKRRIRIYFDIENESTLGIEKDEEIKGNFGKYKAYQTPAVLIVKKRNPKKQIMYRYSDLFDDDANPRIKMESIFF